MAIARVQSKTANSGVGSVTTLNVVLDSTPTAGNTIILAAAGLGTFNIPSDSGITWICHNYVGASSTAVMLAIGRVFSGASATITVNCTSSGGISIAAAEYSASSPLRVDRAMQATATGTSPASGATSTTSTAVELYVCAISHRLSNGVTFSSPTNSFAIVGQDKTTIGSTTFDRSVALLELISSSTGTPNAGATASSSGVWVAQIMTLEQSIAGGGVSRGRML